MRTDLGEVGYIESVLYASIEHTMVYLNLKQNDKYGKTYIKKLKNETKQRTVIYFDCGIKKYLAQAGYFLL